jgi:hypothetical protein
METARKSDFDGGDSALDHRKRHLLAKFLRKDNGHMTDCTPLPFSTGLTEVWISRAARRGCGR